MSFLTCFWLFPQKEHFNRSPPSPIRATGDDSPHLVRAAPDPCLRSHNVSKTCPDRIPRSHSVVEDTTRHLLAPGRPDRHGLARLQDGVDEAVLEGGVGGEDLVALDVEVDL